MVSAKMLLKFKLRYRNSLANVPSDRPDQHVTFHEFGYPIFVLRQLPSSGTERSHTSTYQTSRAGDVTQ